MITSIATCRGMNRERTLCLLEHGDVFSMLMRETLQERIHIEGVVHSRFLLVTACRLKILLIRIEQTGKAPHKCCPDLIRMEGRVTDQADLRCTAVMNGEFACLAFVHAFLSSVITDSTGHLLVPWLGLEVVPLNPACAFGVVDRLHSGLGDNGRSGNGGLGIDGWGIGGSWAVICVQGGH